jgi:hypothetical protein
MRLGSVMGFDGGFRAVGNLIDLFYTLKKPRVAMNG